MAVINTNISSLIGLNNLRLTDLGLRTSLERLSSGLRINKAADDPSGLAIAKGMEAQINGIRMAIMNAEDGKSLIHTADGALHETQDILFRMRDLAVRAANEATLTTADLRKLNNEFQVLKDEIDRKSLAVTFNTKRLFDGAYAYDNFTVGGMAIGSMGQEGALSIFLGKSDGYQGTIPVTLSTIKGQVLQIGPDNNTQYHITVFIAPINAVMMGLRPADNSTQFSLPPVAGGGIYNLNTSNVILWSSGMGLASMRDKAQSAIDWVQNALDYTSDVRAFLGVQERRIDHIIDDLKAMDVNISAAKSRIYDADMAVEITEFTRLQILQQAGTAILAQANAQPQSILQLLR